MNDVRIRPAQEDDAPGISLAHVRSWQAAYRGILPDTFLDGLDPVNREARWRENLRPPMGGRFTFVAEVAQDAAGKLGEIAGFASGGPERDGFVARGVTYDGEIYALYLAQPHWRQGLGRRLVAAAAERLMEQGARSIVIWVLKDNHRARAFYEALGGIESGEKSITIAGAYELVDVAYCWPDARMLLQRAQGAAT